MHSEGLPEWLGGILGTVLRGIVDALRYILVGMGGALHHFAAGFTTSMGIRPSMINFLMLAIGLLLLAAGVRALLRRALVAGIVWLVLAILMLGGLMPG